MSLPLCWATVRSALAISRSMLSSHSAARDGELDGEFLDRRELPERPTEVLGALRGERGRGLGVRSSISSPASFCRVTAADMSVSLLQRCPKAPPTCSPPAHECLFCSSIS